MGKLISGTPIVLEAYRTECMTEVASIENCPKITAQFLRDHEKTISDMSA